MLVLSNDLLDSVHGAYSGGDPETNYKSSSSSSSPQTIALSNRMKAGAILFMIYGAEIYVIGDSLT